jgi:hypothetical protein
VAEGRRSQIKSEFSQTGQSPATLGQSEAKEKAWISLDFLCGIEPFQRVALTPWGKNVCLAERSNNNSIGM